MGIRTIIKRRYVKYSSAPYLQKILYGVVERPWYGHFIYEAGILAKALGHSKVSIIEFGVAGGNGLINIEKHVEIISRELNLDFEIYGFDLTTGLPKSDNYKDMTYAWNPGSFEMDEKKLKAQLHLSKLIIGDVQKTVPEFIERYNPSPIGCIMFDLDYYSATKHAFRIFNEDEKYFMPRVNCYFDDVNLTNEYIGELNAIKEFNEENKNKKISLLYNFGERIYNFWYDWLMFGNRMFQYHNFSHRDYNKPLHSTKRQLHLSKEI